MVVVHLLIMKLEVQSSLTGMKHVSWLNVLFEEHEYFNTTFLFTLVPKLGNFPNLAVTPYTLRIVNLDIRCHSDYQSNSIKSKLK